MRLERRAERLPPFDAKIKAACTCTSLPLLPLRLIYTYVYIHTYNGELYALYCLPNVIRVMK
jgi:hypothetical protein